jgi:hypothetical protein
MDTLAQAFDGSAWNPPWFLALNDLPLAAAWFRLLATRRCKVRRR